jgi:hypothetical protein
MFITWCSGSFPDAPNSSRTWPAATGSPRSASTAARKAAIDGGEVEVLGQIECISEVLLGGGELAALERDPSAHRQHQAVPMHQPPRAGVVHHPLDDDLRSFDLSRPDEVGDDSRLGTPGLIGIQEHASVEELSGRGVRSRRVRRSHRGRRRKYQPLRARIAGQRRGQPP